MARNKNMEPSLQSWDDVDKCLREIGECEIAISEIEADMNIAINEAKERADKLSKPMKESMKLWLKGSPRIPRRTWTARADSLPSDASGSA